MKTKRLTTGLFFILIIFLAACQKELSVENNTPPPPPSTLVDTATLLKIITVNYTNGTASDSNLRIIKNAYINGQKRIVITETTLPAATDTLYTVFNYDSQNQLTKITDSSNVPANYDVYHENIVWQTNKVTKIITDSMGIPYQTDNFTYTPAGVNTNISVKRIPASQDTMYTGGAVFYYNVKKSFLTVNNSFIPVTETYISHTYMLYGSGSGIPGDSYDTLLFKYNYDGAANLSSVKGYSASADTNIWSTPAIREHKDTINYAYTRNAQENPVIYDIVKNIFGSDITMLATFLDLDFGWEEIFGYNNGIYNYYSPINSLYYKQCQAKVMYDAVFWMNGVPDMSNPPASNLVLFNADNSLDAQNRLIKSRIYYSGQTNIVEETRFIYP